jgi:hypothetical protein
MIYLNLFYRIKRHIPRSLQVAARRYILLTKRILHRTRWPIDRQAARRPSVFHGWPGGKRFALVLRHDVETGAGIWRCREILSREQALGLRSAFFFVPEDYPVKKDLRDAIVGMGCEVGVHGLKHDGKLYSSRRAFKDQALRINGYLKEWNSVGFASPSSHHRLDWMHDLNILYDTSSFDTDPFEPQPDGAKTIFPMRIDGPDMNRSFIEIPYTMPQDFTLFVILRENTIRIWKRKLDWIAMNGGMVMFITHPDYMRVPETKEARYTYSIGLYEEILSYIERKYHGAYWNALPREMAEFWKSLYETGIKR